MSFVLFLTVDANPDSAGSRSVQYVKAKPEYLVRTVFLHQANVSESEAIATDLSKVKVWVLRMEFSAYFPACMIFQNLPFFTLLPLCQIRIHNPPTLYTPNSFHASRRKVFAVEDIVPGVPKHASGAALAVTSHGVYFF